MFKADKLITSTDQNSTQNTEYILILLWVFNNNDNGEMCIIRIHVDLECNGTYESESNTISLNKSVKLSKIMTYKVFLFFFFYWIILMVLEIQNSYDYAILYDNKIERVCF